MEKIRIGDACELLNGFAFKSENYVEKGIRIIRIANVQKGYIEDNTPAFYPADSEGLDKYMLEENDLLMSLTGNVGRVAILQKDMLPAALNQRVACLRLKTDRITKGYLFHLLNSDFFEQKCIQSSKGVAQKNMSTEWLKDFLIPVYSVEKQQEITTTLDYLRDIIDKRKQELNKLDELIKARFVEMFGDLADPACKWEKCKLVDTCVNSDDIKCGPFGTQLGKDEYTEEGVAVWEIPQINSEFRTLPTHFVTENKAKELDAYSIIPGDIAMSRKGNVGRCAVFPANFENGIMHSDVLRIRLDETKTFPEFMMRQLHYSGDIQHQIEHVSSGAIMAGINVTNLKHIFVYLPPIELQGEFVAFVAQVDKSKVVVQKSLDETQMLYYSLLQEYFG